MRDSRDGPGVSAHHADAAAALRSATRTSVFPRLAERARLGAADRQCHWLDKAAGCGERNVKRDRWRLSALGWSHAGSGVRGDFGHQLLGRAPQP